LDAQAIEEDRFGISGEWKINGNGKISSGSASIAREG
jgi:hypothetical protein